jgi:hypothetical protein
MPHMVKAPQSQAPFDMNCDAEKLVYHSLGGTTVSVTGCERRFTYVWVDGAGWVANVTSEDAE